MQYQESSLFRNGEVAFPSQTSMLLFRHNAHPPEPQTTSRTQL